MGHLVHLWLTFHTYPLSAKNNNQILKKKAPETQSDETGYIHLIFKKVDFVKIHFCHILRHLPFDECL